MIKKKKKQKTYRGHKPTVLLSCQPAGSPLWCTPPATSPLWRGSSPQSQKHLGGEGTSSTGDNTSERCVFINSFCKQGFPAVVSHVWNRQVCVWACAPLPGKRLNTPMRCSCLVWMVKGRPWKCTAWNSLSPPTFSRCHLTCWCWATIKPGRVSAT